MYILDVSLFDFLHGCLVTDSSFDMISPSEKRVEDGSLNISRLTRTVFTYQSFLEAMLNQAREKLLK
jgi:hypothetical protein